MTHVYLGVDLGTESVRVGLFDKDGTALAVSHAPVHVSFPKPGWAEADAWEYWFCFKEALAKVLVGRPKGATVVGLACGSTSTTLVLVDSEGRILAPAMMWMDARSSRQSAEVQATRHPALRYSGGGSSVEWMVPKVLWVKQERPELYHRAAHAMDMLDWFNWMLTGRLTASLCNTVCKWHRGPQGWDAGFLQSIGLEDVLERWPREVLPMGAVIGPIDHTRAQELNLPDDLLVVQGGIDAYTGMVGSDCLSVGTMSFILGSSSVFLVHSFVPYESAEIWGPFPDAVMPGLWILEAGQVSTGSAARWLASMFAKSSDLGASYKALIDGAAEIPPGSEGVLALDHFQGSRTPFRNPTARGAFLGLSLEHSPAHLFRALMEATACGARACVASITSLGAQVEKLVLCGAGTRNSLWVQIHADTLQLPLHIPEQPGLVGILGCAMLVASAVGDYHDLDQAASAMKQEERIVEPRRSVADVYRTLYERYLDAYQATAALTGERGAVKGGSVVS